MVIGRHNNYFKIVGHYIIKLLTNLSFSKSSGDPFYQHGLTFPACISNNIH